MKYFRYILSVFLVFTVLLLTSCTGIKKVGNRNLRVGVTGMTGEFNPFYAVSDTDKQIMSQMFRTIQYRQSDNRLVNLCGGISYKIDGDKVKYIVSIRDDLYFSDGKNVTIDDIIFFYHFIADASYDGVYKNWYLNDIEGVKEYYYDDRNYAASLDAMNTEAALKYSKETISYDDLKKYLVETELAGKFDEKKAPDGTDWKTYFDKNKLTAEYAALGSKPEKKKLLSLAASCEAGYNKLAYNPEGWYKSSMLKSYMKKNYENGIDVETISGIKKINDYTCTVTFNSHDINAVSEINVPIVSKNFYSVDYVKGLAAKVKEMTELSPGCGPYVIKNVKDDKVTLGTNKYYTEAPDFSVVEFLNYENNEKLFDDVMSGAIDVTTVTATGDRISTLSGSDKKYFVTNDDGYYSLFMNTKKLDLTERKAISGLCDLSAAAEKVLGTSYTVPLRPLSVRFPEYPSSITEKQFGIMDYTSYMLNGKRKLSKLTAYYTEDSNGVQKAMLEALKTILAEKNITLNIVQADSQAVTGAAKSGKADLWIAKVSDGSACDKYEYYNSKGKNNLTAFADPEIDELTNKIHTSVGLNDRTAMIQKLLDMINLQAVEYPLYQLQTVTVYNTEIISTEDFNEDLTFDGFTYALPELEKADKGE